jgi:hypothetical protein
MNSKYGPLLPSDNNQNSILEQHTKGRYRPGEVVKEHNFYVLKLDDKQSTTEMRFRRNTLIFTRNCENWIGFEKINEN